MSYQLCLEHSLMVKIQEIANVFNNYFASVADTER